MLTPYSLCTLQDMLNLPIGALLSAYTSIANLWQALEYLGPGKHLVLPHRQYTEFVQSAREFHAASQAIGLNVTSIPAGLLLDELARGEEEADGFHFRGVNLAQLHGRLQAITICMQNEAQLKVAFVLSPDKEEYFSPKGPLFGPLVHARFTCIIYEIDEAAKCLSFGRATATVFHLMRILEVGLKSVHCHLGIDVDLSRSNKNWGSILTRIRDDIQLRGAGWPERDFFQEIFARLDAIKDAWRNPTMHVEKVYLEQEAKVLFDNTRALMQKIATRMDENGAAQMKQVLDPL